MKKCTCFFPILLLNTLNMVLHAQATIPTKYFGINTWMPASVGSSTDSYFLNNGNYPVNVNGDFYNILSNTTQIQGLGLKNLRYGGISHDFNRPTIAQYNEFITAAQSLGAEPIIQISFLNQIIKDRQANSAITTFTCATNFVASAYFTNLINAIKSNTTYYSIGNEPDLYSSGFTIAGATIGPADIGGNLGYFKVISDAIKTMDPGAIIIGPDLAWAHSESGGWMEQFISSNIATDISRPGSTGAPICDIFAFHTYPFDGTGTQTRSAIISHPSSTFQNDLTLIRNRITSNSNNANLKIAVTELNVDYKNQAANTVTDISANSYLAGQWLTEMLAIGLNTPTGKAPIVFTDPWSVHQAGGNQTIYDLGILDGAYPNQKPRATYYILQMLSNNFITGSTYLPNVSTAGGQTNYKAFAYQTANEVGVLIMNQSTQSPRGADNSTEGFTINFDGTTPSTGPMKFSFNTAASYTGGAYTGCAIQKESTMFLKFNNSGAIIYNEVYTLQDALRGASDVGPNTWVGGAYPTITTQALYTAYSPTNNTNVYGDIFVIPSSGNAITATTNNIFQFTNSAKIDGAAAAFSSGTKTLCITAADQTCH